MVGVRLGVSMVLALAVLFDGLRAQMPLAAFALVVGLVAIVTQTNQPQTMTVRRLSMFDLALLTTVFPIAALNGFVAAEPDSLLPAERAAMLQTGGALLIVLGLVIAFAMYLFPDDDSFVGAAALPALLAVLSISFVLHDFRNQTVLAMFAVSYFVGATAIGIGSVVEPAVRRFVPAAFYVSTLVTGAVLFDPGLGNVFTRDGMVQMFSGMTILFGLAVVFAIPAAHLDLSRTFAQPSRQSRRRTETAERNSDDSDRRLEARSRPPV
jgi:hypothetical protein